MWAIVSRALRGSGHSGQHVGQRSLPQRVHQAPPASAVIRSDRTRWIVDDAPGTTGYEGAP